MWLLATSLISFHIFYSRSVLRAILSFQLNGGRRAVISVVVMRIMFSFMVENF
jgi:hypothetical protein